MFYTSKTNQGDENWQIWADVYSHNTNYLEIYLKSVEIPKQNQRNKRKKKYITTKNSKDRTMDVYLSKKAKLKDLLHLTQFLANSDAQSLYQMLFPDNASRQDESDIEFADEG